MPRRLSLSLNILLLACAAAAQPPDVPGFEVASVKGCQQLAGPDYNNRIVISASAYTARNTTLRRLIADAYDLQLRQIAGPAWLDENEYDIDARTSTPADRGRIALMLRALLADRFALKQHAETKEMRVYALVPTPSPSPSRSTPPTSSAVRSTDRGATRSTPSSPDGLAGLPIGSRLIRHLLHSLMRVSKEFAGKVRAVFVDANAHVAYCPISVTVCPTSSSQVRISWVLAW